MAFCRGCAKEISDGAVTCPQCGAPQLAYAGGGNSAAVVAQPGFFHWYVDVLKKYAVFSGRARRKEYWMFFLISFLISIALAVVDAIIGSNSMISNVYSLALLIPSLAVGVRRLHDTDRSGWWLIVPFANIVFLATEGQKGDNRFGPAPQ
ncbi:uncharacterized membrane protein YhaH (DUF805 family) [Pseudomonas graminis]|uniref:DUF805 domain-containing protein n=1 Tax=Pseudomonas graminis TaxID=158627 RepID=UPI00105C246B|nr:DUF805 domain-containing protein [Pseudomonas graminis]TDV41941.1 uncharacterized membrane protein YhaH (DUF805 family) [Pseudomonas graminis]